MENCNLHVSSFFDEPFSFHFNMLWLWWMGRPVEEEIGPRSFLTVYFGAGFVGALIDVIVSLTGTPIPVIGASGAVYGIMVAFAMLFPKRPIMLFLLPPIEARYVVGGLIALDVLFLNNGDSVARFCSFRWSVRRLFVNEGKISRNGSKFCS